MCLIRFLNTGKSLYEHFCWAFRATQLFNSHSVVTTVRSQDKVDRIKQAHSNVSKDKLDFAIVEDIGKEGAFEKAVVSDPPFEAVIHTASVCQNTKHLVSVMSLSLTLSLAFPFQCTGCAEGIFDCLCPKKLQNIDNS